MASHQQITSSPSASTALIGLETWRRLLDHPAFVLDVLVNVDSSDGMGKDEGNLSNPHDSGRCGWTYMLGLRRSSQEMEATATACGSDSRGISTNYEYCLRLHLRRGAHKAYSLSPSPGQIPHQCPQSSLKLKEDFNRREGTAVGTRLLLSDDAINIWEFRLGTEERCQFHRHTIPYFFTNLTYSMTQELDKEGKKVGNVRKQEIGQTFFVEDKDLGQHAVRNVGGGEFIQFVVEMKEIGLT